MKKFKEIKINILRRFKIFYKSVNLIYRLIRKIKIFIRKKNNAKNVQRIKLNNYKKIKNLIKKIKEDIKEIKKDITIINYA